MSLPELSVIRFGYGVDALAPQVVDKARLLADLEGPDAARLRFSRETTEERLTLLAAYRDARKMEGDQMMASDTLRKRLRQRRLADLRTTMLRPLWAKVGFRERLVAFWADHFTVAARGLNIATLIGPYHDEAIRPNIAGRFADLLIAAVTHPAMLLYLDQQTSIGPNARRARGKQGLNENLAREILELHTLGVGAAYGQQDVTQFAELLTGLRVRGGGMIYVPGLAEPGAETVLGTSYEGESLETIRGALEDIARHPETAAHLARKLAVHFVSDTPDAGLVAAMEAAYLGSDGDLTAVYAALLDHPAAWSAELQKVKPPMDYMISAARAVGVGVRRFADMNRRQLAAVVAAPLSRMGQTPFQPSGPDGWPEEASAWVTPAQLAARLEWAASLAEELAGRTDPRILLDIVLPGMASDALRFAVEGTESGWEGVALMLASPEFNRR